MVWGHIRGCFPLQIYAPVDGITVIFERGGKEGEKF
jgi:hypothetical protein